MKKIVIGMCFVLSIGTMTSATFDATIEKRPQESNVYICDSDGATKYHLKKDCRGLSNCKHKIISVSLADAKKKGKKTLCGWED